MISYNISGLEMEFSEFDTVRLKDATLTLTLTEGSDFINYLITEENPGDLPNVDLGATVQNADIGDITSIPPSDSFFLGQVVSSLGTHIVLGYSTPTLIGDSNFIFNIGGDHLPSFFDGNEAFEFFINDTISEPVVSGPFAEGTDIPLSTFLNTAEATNGGGDVFDGGDGNDSQSGDIGDDDLSGGGGDDSLDGGDGDDTVRGGSGDDDLNGGGGDDTVASGDGNDSANGGGGNDAMGGGQGDDTMNGDEGNDTMGGGQGDDSLNGGADDDIVNGGGGDDSLEGGDGDDTMGGGFNHDSISGGAGNDNLGGGSGRDTISGGDGDDSVGGGDGDDSISGDAGNDFLAGGRRDDVIDGGAGDDRINGGRGNDTMTGGDGADKFIFNNFFNGDADVVTDFEVGVDHFRLAGVEGAPNSGLQGKLDALNITDVAGGAEFSVDGNTVLVQGVAAADLGLDDFIFV